MTVKERVCFYLAGTKILFSSHAIEQKFKISNRSQRHLFCTSNVLVEASFFVNIDRNIPKDYVRKMLRSRLSQFKLDRCGDNEMNNSMATDCALISV